VGRRFCPHGVAGLGGRDDCGVLQILCCRADSTTAVKSQIRDFDFLFTSQNFCLGYELGIYMKGMAVKVRFEREICCGASICSSTRSLVELKRDEAELSAVSGMPEQGFCSASTRPPL
jgi:hypothetical protein